MTCINTKKTPCFKSGDVEEQSTLDSKFKGLIPPSPVKIAQKVTQIHNPSLDLINANGTAHFLYFH
jgi:hypothetical protein